LLQAKYFPGKIEVNIYFLPLSLREGLPRLSGKGAGGGEGPSPLQTAPGMA